MQKIRLSLIFVQLVLNKYSNTCPQSERKSVLLAVDDLFLVCDGFLVNCLEDAFDEQV